MNTATKIVIGFIGLGTLNGLVQLATNPYTPPAPPAPVALNVVAQNINTALAADDRSCRTPLCKENRNDLYSNTSASANSATSTGGSIESVNVQVDSYSRNDDGTYRIVGDIIGDRNDGVLGASLLLGGIAGLFGQGDAGAAIVSEGVKLAAAPTQYVVHDENFAGINSEIDVIIDNVSFASLEGFDKGEIITLSNISGLRDFAEFGSCGIFKKCSTFSDDSVRFTATSANGAAYKF